MVLVAAGVGITPLRALLEDLPSSVDVTAIVRGSTTEDLVHRDEVAALLEQRDARLVELVELVGSRAEVRFDAKMLRRLVPDLAQRDLYICGPEAFSDAVEAAARRLGVRGDQIHREAFAF